MLYYRKRPVHLVLMVTFSSDDGVQCSLFWTSKPQGPIVLIGKYGCKLLMAALWSVGPLERTLLVQKVLLFLKLFHKRYCTVFKLQVRNSIRCVRLSVGRSVSWLVEIFLSNKIRSIPTTPTTPTDLPPLKTGSMG